MRRRLGAGAGAALTLAALTFAGCGSSGDFAAKIGGDRTTTTEPGPAAASPGGDAQLSPAAAARSVNLRAEDFPYLEESEVEGSSSDGDESQREFEKCAGDVQLSGKLASAESPSFNGALGAEYLEFSSEAEVFATAAAAERVASLLRGHRVYACLNRLLKPALEREEAGNDLERISVRTQRLPTPDAGLPDAFGYRIVARIAPSPESRQLTAYAPGETPDGRPTLNVYIDLLVFVSGRVEVSLTADGSPQPVTPALERNLLRLLRTRAVEAERKLPG